MIETWRWFGPEDPVSLTHIVQAGASGVVSSLHHLPTGEAWSDAEVGARNAQIRAAGLYWAVVESIPVHNDIKLRRGAYQQRIANYQASLRAVGRAGIRTVCYNFMPVLDWTRTSLMYPLPNRSYALRFEVTDLAAYDLFILCRPLAELTYPPGVLETARLRFELMSEAQRAELETNVIAGLPGGDGSYDRDGIRAAIADYHALGEQQFRANLIAFLREVLPVAEEAGVRLCIHPDDPPFSLFGLPRVVSTADDVRVLQAAAPSPSNGLTLCAGSFGARADNDLVAIAREFAPHIHFTHLRNIRREADGSFFESEHLSGDNDMVGLISALLEEEGRRRAQGDSDSQIAMRPDHGHLMGDEVGRNDVNPGYSFAGRLKGLAELRGVIHALDTARARGVSLSALTQAQVKEALHV